MDLFNASLVLLYFGSCLKVSSLQFLLQNRAQLDVLPGVSITSTSFMPPILHLTEEVRSALNQDKVKFSYELGEGVAEEVWPGPRCYSIPTHIITGEWVGRRNSLLKIRAFFLVGRECGEKELNWYHHRLSM